MPMMYERAPSESISGSNQHLLDTEDMVDAMNEKNKLKDDNGGGMDDEDERMVIEDIVMTTHHQEMAEFKLPNRNYDDDDTPAETTILSDAKTRRSNTNSKNKKMWLVPVIKLTMYSIILALILSILTSVIIYESSITALESFRRLPASRNFESAYYAPSRAWVLSGYQQFSNSCYEPTKEFLSSHLQMITNKVGSGVSSD